MDPILEKNNFKIVKQVIPTVLTNFIYDYFLHKRKVARHLFDTRFISPYTEYFGAWTDSQVPNTYAHYADLVMENLLIGLKPKVEQESGLSLHETYSYARIYKVGDVLARHKDRASCAVSATLHLGGDKDWPLYLEPSGKKGQAGISIDLKPGDMILYSGCKVEHWREPYPGQVYTQVFLHYDDIKNEKTRFDGRPFVGLPGYYRRGS